MRIYSFFQLYVGISVLLLLAPAAVAQVSLNAAVLPSSRASTVGTPVTVFATVSNGGNTDATGCLVSLPNTNSNPSGIAFSYRAFLSDNATPAAPVDTPVDIAANSNQAFVLTLTPSTTFTGTNIAFDFMCNGSIKAPVFTGVNTLSLSASSSPTPDIITIGATSTNDGVVHIASLGGGEVMTVAAVNIGSGLGTTPIIVAADTGDIPLPLDIFVCETDPVTSLCKNPPSTTVNTVIGSSASTFAVFANSTQGAGVPNFPDMARLHMRYFDGSAAPDNPQTGISRPAAAPPAGAGSLFGATSTGITSPGPNSVSSDLQPFGIWRIRSQNNDGTEDVGFLTVSDSGGIEAAMYVPNSSAFPDPFVFMFGGFNNANPPNGSAQRSIETSFSFLEEQQDSSFVLNSFSGSGVWTPKNNVLISFTPDPGSSGVSGNFKLVYTGEFDRAVTLADLAGTYDGVDQDTDTGALAMFGTLSIASEGTLSGNINPSGEPGDSCSITGSLSALAFPGTDGSGNLFDVNIVLAGNSCSLTGPLSGKVFMENHQNKANGKTYNNSLSFILRDDSASFATGALFVPTGTISFP
jgi:hypothetical protein